MLDLAARLAQGTHLSLVDGGNCFHPYQCSRAVGRLLRPGQSLKGQLERIHIARAFTCYQMLTLLAELPEARSPLLVLDLLATFYDESVPAAEAVRLLEECTAHLHRLSASAPVVASLRPGRPGALAGERGALLEIMQAAAGRVWILEPPAAPARQLPLLFTGGIPDAGQAPKTGQNVET
jgi:hypothetical protein